MPQNLRDAYLDITHDPARLQTMFDRDVHRMVDFKDWTDEAIRSIQAPTLVMISDEDVTKPEHAVEMCRLLPHGRLIVLPGHHGAFLEQAGPLALSAAAMIEGFLGDPPPAIQRPGLDAVV
jgi:pimeloyl-ACP methyl ester carboxylesterase